MKKLTLLLLTALFLLAGCADDKPIEYVIYGDGDSFMDLAGSNSDASVEADTTQLLSASKLDVKHTNRQSFTNDSAPQTRKFTINGDTYDLILANSYRHNLATCTNEAIQKYGILDQYKYQPEPTGVYICAEYDANGTLLFYTDLHDTEAISGDLTESEAQKISQKLIQTIYGKEVAAEYTFDDVMTGKGFFYVNYVKMICGYPTLDSIRITLHGNGKVNAILAKQRGIFTPLEKSITTDKIDAAKKALMEQVGGDWEPKEIHLAVGADGKCYLQVRRSFDCTYYINID